MVTESKETNINVVVRVRPRNQKEIRENSPVVVTTTSSSPKELTIRAGPHDMNTKTYQFDRVFGPDSSQDAVFSEVVQPLLDEVLMGFNCTIFATGAGKTFTMEGNLLDSVLGKDAGIIPRSLRRLFETLQEDSSEYSVKVSFIEIYNEELRDLLSTGDERDNPKLKIFDDVQRRGSTLIAGAEEIIVSNADDVLELLQRGSNKRQVATTKMNEASSRSHSIFSVTVHIKESTSDGEDLLKVGKLNLVDLAGSENIGRSGAENRRAKEAGMINQSLLTLGRVINSLVDKLGHIPYRESKLTRILQDSLGGRTKTCIIAAVSPSKSNIEESLSTLDYAHRAKNIRNKPEINQKMTKRSLIKDYQGQIERLKADLHASREKNGIYLSAESYSKVIDENQSNKDRIEELAKIISEKEEGIKALEIEFERNLKLIDDMNLKLNQTNLELESKSEHLKAALTKFEAVQMNLEEQKLLTHAHAETEARLSSLASGLVLTLHSAKSDFDGLFRKLERKSNVEMENLKIFKDFQSGMTSELTGLVDHIEKVTERSKIALSALSKDVDGDFSNREKLSRSLQQAIKSNIDGISAVVEQLYSTSFNEFSKSCSHLQDVKDLLVGTKDLLRKISGTTVQSHTHNSSILCQMIESYKGELNRWQSAMECQLQQFMKSATESLIHETSMQQTKASAILKQHEAEMRALKAENERLKQMVSGINFRSEKSCHDTIEKVTELLYDHFASQERAYSEFSLAAIHQSDSCVNTLDRCMVGFQETVDHLSLSKDLTIDILNKESVDMRNEQTKLQQRSVEECDKIISQVNLSHNSAMESQEKDSAEIIENVTAVTSFIDKGLHDTERFQQSFSDLKESACSHRVHAITTIAEQFSQSIEASRTSTNALKKKFTQQSKALSDSVKDTVARISAIKNELNCNNLSLDQPTGKTPRKTQIKVPTTVVRTRNHEDILQQFRTRGDISLVEIVEESKVAMLPVDEVADAENIPPQNDAGNANASKLPRRR